MKAQKISPDFENSDDITARTIIRHAHRFTSAIDRVADVELRKKLDLSLSHVKIMIAIHKKLCCSQQDAASFWGITPAAISRQVSLLKKSGYVEEKLVGSKRAVLLTPSGKKKMEKAFSIFDHTFEMAFGLVSEKDKKTTLQSLILMRKGLASHSAVKKHDEFFAPKE